MEKLVTNQALVAKVMKITLLQCLLTVLFMGNTWANEGKAQDALNKNVSLNIHNMEIENALNQIEKLTQVFLTNIDISNIDFKFKYDVLSLGFNPFLNFIEKSQAILRINAYFTSKKSISLYPC